MKFVVICVCLFITACASTTSYKVTSPEHDETANGIRHYEPAPFLLVYSDTKGHLQSNILILPDTTELRVIDAYSFMANNNSVMKFQNGMLIDSKSIIDETAVAKQALTSLKGAATAIAAEAFDAPSQMPSMESPHLYKIILNGGVIKLVGGPSRNADGSAVRIELKKTANDAAGGGGS